MTRTKKINIGLIITTATALMVGIGYPVFSKSSTERNKLEINVAKLIVSHGTLKSQINELKDCNKNTNGRVDVLTDDIKQIKTTVAEIKELVKEQNLAIEKLGGKINYQNVILRNGETTDIYKREH